MRWRQRSPPPQRALQQEPKFAQRKNSKILYVVPYTCKFSPEENFLPKIFLVKISTYAVLATWCTLMNCSVCSARDIYDSKTSPRLDGSWRGHQGSQHWSIHDSGSWSRYHTLGGCGQRTGTRSRQQNPRLATSASTTPWSPDSHVTNTTNNNTLHMQCHMTRR